MKRDRNSRQSPQGSTLVLSLIVLVMLSALATAMATMAGANAQMAENQRQGGRALGDAHSGLEVLRYYLQGINLSASVSPAERLQDIASQLQTRLAGPNEVDMNVSYDAGTRTLTITPVTLNAQSNESFAATLSHGDDYDTLDVVVTGSTPQVDRQVSVQYEFDTIGNPLFDFGIATRGPLNMQGNVDITGYNEEIEASIYIESLCDILALEMTGKSAVAGRVTIANGSAAVAIGNSSSIHGATGTAALQYIKIGDTPCEFPIPNPSEFAHYIQHTFDPATDPTSNVTLTNVEIPMNTNPSFSGHATIKGVMYIRSPNTVTFTGNATIQGLIVAEGSLDAEPSSLRHLDFGGSVDSYDVSTLPPEQFGDLTEQTGTFILAPGFSVCFRGSFETLNGVIAASGIEFQGNAGGTINGSIINYADECMSLAGNTDLVFNRSGVEECPAGFQPSTTVRFVANSYNEPVL